HVINCLLLLFFPSLPMAAFTFATIKFLDYSVFRASKEVLYIPLSYDARYRAKQVIDAFTHRAAKGITTGMLSLAKLAFGTLPAFLYPVIGIFACGGWVALAFPLTAHLTPKSAEFELKGETKNA
ncbi:MAG: hypothetical protein NTW04_05735, partial [Elusimicrobia bacterium]|nr:hypothetical protein [Elusimicrobiota bacterium]